VATLVFFHAHPDDESIGTGGTIAKAVHLGHRVVVVVATNGELGAEPEGLLGPGESLSERRLAETVEAAGILGVHRLEFLGYRDSGMMGTASNEDPDCFWATDVDAAAGRLAAILVGEGADMVTIYDETGVTGHPDHIQVHRVGVRAAARAGVGEVLEGTMSRSQARRLIRHAAGADAVTLDRDLDVFGTPDELITDKIDVRAYLDVKRRAMAAHASQISETSLFLSLPPAVFEEVWGYECCIRRGGTHAGFENLFGSEEAVVVGPAGGPTLEMGKIRPADRLSPYGRIPLGFGARSTLLP
jgi:LmbE family N-acetylglucosaminyl deacetylase